MSTESSFQLNVVSAEESIYSGSVRRLFVSGTVGQMEIAPEHAPTLTPLVPGTIRIAPLDGDEILFYISGGVLEVQPKMSTLLADTITRADELDEAYAEEAMKRAKEKLEHSSDIDYSSALAELAQATAQMRLIQELRKRK